MSDVVSREAAKAVGCFGAVTDLIYFLRGPRGVPALDHVL